MQVKLLFENGDLRILDDLQMMVVCDNNDNPVSLAYRMGPAFVVACIDDLEKFNVELRRLGLDRTVFVADMRSELTPTADLPLLG